MNKQFLENNTQNNDNKLKHSDFHFAYAKINKMEIKNLNG